jgi:uncharacterized membrane protein YfcA
LSGVEILLATAAVLVGSTLQGAVGFGLGLLASPILMLIEPRFVPASILLSTLLVTTVFIAREHHAIDVTGLGWALAGRLPGTVVAAAVLASLPEVHMATLFGALVLAGVGMSLSGVRFEPHRPQLFLAGFLSGVMGTIASIGGPPMALVYQRAEGPRLRSTMASFFWFGTIMSLVALWTIGRLGTTDLRLTAMLVPGLLAGLVTSRWAARAIDRGHTRRVVLAVAAVSGLVVIVRQLV